MAEFRQVRLTTFPESIEQGRKKTEKTLSFFFYCPIQKSQSHNTTMNQNPELIHFNVEELTQYTNDFANQLSQRGGFGSTFRGMIPKNNPHNICLCKMWLRRGHTLRRLGMSNYMR